MITAVQPFAARKFRTFLPSCFKDLPERIYSGQGNDRGMEHMVCEQGLFLTLRYVADRVVVARGDGIQTWMAFGTAVVFKSVHEMDSVRGSFIKGRKIVVFVLFLSWSYRGISSPLCPVKFHLPSACS